MMQKQRRLRRRRKKEKAGEKAAEAKACVFVVSLLCLCVARACRHHLSRVQPYRAGVQSEPDCSSPFYLT